MKEVKVAAFFLTVSFRGCSLSLHFSCMLNFVLKGRSGRFGVEFGHLGLKDT